MLQQHGLRPKHAWGQNFLADEAVLAEIVHAARLGPGSVVVELGAAGGLEAIFTVLALRDQVAPPTLNLTAPDGAAAGLDLVALQPRRLAFDHALSNGFGFGGVNASVVFSRWAG